MTNALLYFIRITTVLSRFLGANSHTYTRLLSDSAQVAAKFNFQRLTVYYAFNFFDRLLSVIKVPVCKDRLQLLGVTGTI